MDNHYSITTAAARLDCHPETLRRIIRRGELTALKVGKSWRIRESDLVAYLAAHTVEAKTDATK
jgi:excisionase family DNA binding protein